MTDTLGKTKVDGQKMIAWLVQKDRKLYNHVKFQGIVLRSKAQPAYKCQDLGDYNGLMINAHIKDFTRDLEVASNDLEVEFSAAIFTCAFVKDSFITACK